MKAFILELHYRASAIKDELTSEPLRQQNENTLHRCFVF